MKECVAQAVNKNTSWFVILEEKAGAAGILN